MQGKDLTVFGDGEQTRAFSYIGDVAPYIANSVNVKEAYNEVFNIGADKEYSVNELAETVIDALAMKGKLRHLDPRNEVVHAYADHTKAKKVFNIKNSVPLIEGINRMAMWAKKAGIQKSQKFNNIEITDKLPSIWLED
jgi:UDP-glucose 4-epimerase